MCVCVCVCVSHSVLVRHLTERIRIPYVERVYLLSRATLNVFHPFRLRLTRAQTGFVSLHPPPPPPPPPALYGEARLAHLGLRFERVEEVRRWWGERARGRES